ncbi:hypothetical protein CLCR_03722 [Cladophialophora carrionii]|uniref:Uncharacterized protein n=1 Tax=Cladophialophora carrionii TaxID=86049 RepID=A0A1C1CFV5_9EURO|nr:hypothetical protein CLCR_03722 [Cladophialophora carrionii]
MPIAVAIAIAITVIVIVTTALSRMRTAMLVQLTDESGGRENIAENGIEVTRSQSGQSSLPGQLPVQSTVQSIHLASVLVDDLDNFALYIWVWVWVWI